MDSVTYLMQFESCDDIGNGDFSRIYEIANEHYALLAENDLLKAACLNMYSALYSAEAVLADIGDSDRYPGEDVAWCERRAYYSLPKVRSAIAAWNSGKTKPSQSPCMEELRMLAQGAIDAMTQSKVYPSDVSAAIGSMRHLLALIDAHKGE